MKIEIFKSPVKGLAGCILLNYQQWSNLKTVHITKRWRLTRPGLEDSCSIYQIKDVLELGKPSNIGKHRWRARVGKDILPYESELTKVLHIGCQAYDLEEAKLAIDALEQFMPKRYKLFYKLTNYLFKW